VLVEGRCADPEDVGEMLLYFAQLTAYWRGLARDDPGAAAHHPEVGTQPVSLSIQANGAGKPPVLDSDGAARFQAVWSRSLDAERSYPAYPEAHCIRVRHELLEGARG